MNTLRSILLLLGGLTALARSAEPVKVLYITHLPGRYHDYKAQMAEFEKQVPQYAKVEITWQAGTHAETEAFLRKPDYAKDHDVIVYNLCFAHNMDVAMAHNIISQTRELGKPAVLVHCAMHTFWVNLGKEGSREADKRPALKKKWKAEHPRLPWPDWSEFSGLDTKRHDKQRALTLRRAKPVHPVVADFPDEWKIIKDELYQNAEFKQSSTPILVAYSEQSKKDHVLAWENRCGAGKVFGITLGHGMETFRMPEFHRILANGILHLSGHLGKDGKAKPGYEGSGK